MDSNTPAVITSVMTTATFTQGLMLFVTQNATFITTSSIAITAAVGVVASIWGKVNESKRIKIEQKRADEQSRLATAQEVANQVNEAAITNKIHARLDNCYKPSYTISEIKEKLSK